MRKHVIARVFLDSGTEPLAVRKLIQEITASSGSGDAMVVFDGRVLEWGLVDKSIPVPSGIPSIGDARIRIADPDFRWRRLLSYQTPRRRLVQLKLITESENETVNSAGVGGIQLYLGEIADAMFGPVWVELSVKDRIFSWLDEEIPGFINRTNFPDLAPGSDEAFFPIVQGQVISPPENPQGVIKLPHIGFITDSGDRYAAASHELYSVIAIYRRLPGGRSSGGTPIVDSVTGGILLETVDSSQPASAASPTTTIPGVVTPSSDNRLILVKVIGDASVAWSVTASAHNGVGMTRLGGAVGTLSQKRVDFWYMIAPPTGTHDVDVTLNRDWSDLNSRMVVVEVYSGVNQSDPLGSIVIDANNATSPSLTVPSAVGELVTDGVIADQALGIGPGQTERANETLTGSRFGGASTEPGATSVTMTWSTSSGTNWCGAAVSIKPADDTESESEIVAGDFELVDPAEYNVTVEPFSPFEVPGFVNIPVTYIDFIEEQPAGTEIRMDAEGILLRGDMFGLPGKVNQLLRNPIDFLMNMIFVVMYKAGIGAEAIGPNSTIWNVASFADLMERFETMIDEGDSGGGAAGTAGGTPFLCDGCVVKSMTVREWLSQFLSSTQIHMFVDRSGLITVSFLGEENPDRPVFDLMLKNSFHEEIAKPTINQLRYRYGFNFATNEWASIDAFDNESDQGLIGDVIGTDSHGDPEREPKVETGIHEMYFVRDPATALFVAAKRMSFLALGSYRQHFMLPISNIENVELSQQIGLTTPFGLDINGYSNREAIITQIVIDMKRLALRVHTILRIPQALEFPPRVISIDPECVTVVGGDVDSLGATMAEIVITGLNLGNVTDATISGNGVSIQITSVTNTQVTATVTIDANANLTPREIRLLSERGMSGPVFLCLMGDLEADEVALVALLSGDLHCTFEDDFETGPHADWVFSTGAPFNVSGSVMNFVGTTESIGDTDLTLYWGRVVSDVPFVGTYLAASMSIASFLSILEDRRVVGGPAVMMMEFTGSDGSETISAYFISPYLPSAQGPQVALYRVNEGNVELIAQYPVDWDTLVSQRIGFTAQDTDDGTVLVVFTGNTIIGTMTDNTPGRLLSGGIGVVRSEYTFAAYFSPGQEEPRLQYHNFLGERVGGADCAATQPIALNSAPDIALGEDSFEIFT